jgi:D-alanyl-D-alanine dipeptidase
MATGREVDMGTPFDYFGAESHPDYRGVTEEQYEMRMLLQQVMVRAGFVPYECEWWHFTLENEPFPNTYFSFPVSSAYLRRR